MTKWMFAGAMVLTALPGCEWGVLPGSSGAADEAETIIRKAVIESQNEIFAAVNEVAAARPSLFYLMIGSSGTFAGTEGQPNRFALTITGLNPDVVYFSDHPNRIAGHEDLATFIDGWQTNGFVEDPPNAALILHEEDETRDVMIVELTGPSYDASADTLTFTATVLTDAVTGGLADYAAKADDALPESFAKCALLIDNGESGSTITFMYNPAQDASASGWMMWHSAPRGFEDDWLAGFDMVELGDDVDSISIHGGPGIQPCAGHTNCTPCYFIRCPADGQAYTLEFDSIYSKESLPAGFSVRYGYRADDTGLVWLNDPDGNSEDDAESN